jgi:hypothetical protein
MDAHPVLMRIAVNTACQITTCLMITAVKHVKANVNTDASMNILVYSKNTQLLYQLTEAMPEEQPIFKLNLIKI